MVINLQIKINKEIRDIEEDIYWGMSRRKLVSSVLCFVIVLGVFMAMWKNGFSLDIACVIASICGMPIGAFGFIKWHGMTFEKALLSIAFNELTPKELVFKGKNIQADEFDLYIKNMQSTEKEANKEDKVWNREIGF